MEDDKSLLCVLTLSETLLKLPQTTVYVHLMLHYYPMYPIYPSRSGLYTYLQDSLI